MSTQEPGPRPAASKSSRAAALGWASRLAGLTSAGIVIQAFTGWWQYLAPFSTSAQIQVAAHAVVGVLMVAPCIVYLVRHIRDWYAQKPTIVMVTGYALAAAILTCLASGLWLTWEAARGPKISPMWDLVHLVGGLVATVLFFPHVVLAYLGRRHAAQQGSDLRRGVRVFTRRVAGATLFAAAMLAVVVMSLPAGQGEIDPPESYRLSAYVDQFEEYRGNPFAPSYARTASRKFVAPEFLANSASCGAAGCHQQIYEEWQPSAHRFSAMNPPFQQIQKNFAADRNPAETRYCAGCHDPISLFAGAKDIHNLELGSPGTQEGCSCVACHSIATVDQRGNADYELVTPQKYLWEDADGWKKSLSNFLIRAYPRQHLADYDRAVLRSPEFCGACHKQFIPEALNRFGLVPGQNQYDEWRTSHWHVGDPDKNLSCVDCHMRLVNDSTDPGRGEAGAVRRSADDGAHRHHGTIATNFLMPQVLKLPGWERQVRLTEEWMRGETVIDEIAHLWPPGPVASLEIVAPKEVRPGEEVRLRAMVVNRKAGHYLTTGPLDFMRAWIHLRVTDSSGAVVAEWGAIDPKTRSITDEPEREHVIGNSRQEGTLVLEGQPINGAGEPILEHELWTMAGGKGKRVVFPGYTDTHSYVFRAPSADAGPLHITADFNFRRYRQDFLDRVVPDMERTNGVFQPTVTQSSARATISIGREHAAE
jgi:hypothetical protein